ncbi:MAG: P1 family peptidase [Oscillospiraceae bacterium]|nr:P1 family peptidase [Oscillospiraceae bacterium]
MGIPKDLFDFKIGTLELGKKNLISDVEGVRVGHFTLDDGNIHTGITAILPHQGNIFREKVVAASYVINGFGKSTGLIQIDELGTIETPIILTNTLSVGTALSGLVKYMLKENEDIGISTGTVNAVVCECNDGYLNDIRGMNVKEEHVKIAIENAIDDFKEGAFGAGTGMSCFEFKGGIGSASRVVNLDNKDYVLGGIVLSNFGSKQDFILNGKKFFTIEEEKLFLLEKGSIIIVLATDIPLNERQLKRISKRASIGLSRTGSFLGNGSGDIVISFTTSNKIKHYEERDIINMNILNENKMDLVFRAVAEVTEESVISSLVHSKTMIGRDGNVRKSLMEFI